MRIEKKLFMEVMAAYGFAVAVDHSSDWMIVARAKHNGETAVIRVGATTANLFIAGRKYAAADRTWLPALTEVIAKYAAEVTTAIAV